MFPWYIFYLNINCLHKFRKPVEFKKVKSTISSFIRVCFLLLESNLQMFPEMVDLEYNKSETYENIRVFTAALEASEVPLYDLKSVLEKWSRPSPGKNVMCDYVCISCWLCCCFIDILVTPSSVRTFDYNTHFSHCHYSLPIIPNLRSSFTSYLLEAGLSVCDGK